MRTIAMGVVLVGCHSMPPPTMPVDESWLEITDPAYAKAHSNVTKHTALPFEFKRDGVDGTQLMLQFLGMSADRGVHYAADIEIIVQLEHNGSTVECVSKVVREGSEPPPTEVTSNAPSDDEAGTTTIRNWHPDLVTAEVDDHDYKCERHASQLAFTQKTGNPMEGPYMPDQKELFYLNTPASPEIVTADWADTCKLVTTHHQVKRYEHFVAAHFQPPDWDKLSKVFADRKLVELPAECHAIAPRAHHVQRVEADLSYSGNGPVMTKKPVRDRSEYKWPADLSGIGGGRYGHVMR